MKSVLISIQRPHTDNIKALIKKFEVRKNKPNQETPFPCFIYETKTKGGCGKVIGDFVCDKITDISVVVRNCNEDYNHVYHNDECKGSCLTWKELQEYGKGKPLYGWHISDLKIYDKPKELGNFFTPMGKRPSYMIERPPQSYMYVEEL